MATQLRAVRGRESHGFSSGPTRIRRDMIKLPIRSRRRHDGGNGAALGCGLPSPQSLLPRAADGLLDWEDVGSPEIVVLSAPHPIYSEECRRHGIQSEVYVEVVLGDDGRLYEPVVYRLYDLAVFYYPILVTMADWEFEPHIVDGNPATFTYKLTFSFSVP